MNQICFQYNFNCYSEIYCLYHPNSNYSTFSSEILYFISSNFWSGLHFYFLNSPFIGLYLTLGPSPTNPHYSNPTPSLPLKSNLIYLSLYCYLISIFLSLSQLSLVHFFIHLQNLLGHLRNQNQTKLIQKNSILEDKPHFYI